MRTGSSLPDAGLTTTWMRRYGASAIVSLRPPTSDPRAARRARAARIDPAHCPASRPAVTCFGRQQPRGTHRHPPDPGRSQRKAGHRRRPRRRGEPRRLCGACHPLAVDRTGAAGQRHPRRDPRRALGRLAAHAGPELQRGSADGAPGGRRHRSLRLDPRRCDGRAGGGPARRDRDARRHRLRGRDHRRAQRLLRRIMGRRSRTASGSPSRATTMSTPTMARRCRRTWAARPPGTDAPGSRTTSGRGTSSSSTGTAASSRVSAATAPTRRRGSGTTLRRADASCTVALLHQPLFSSGQHGDDRGVRTAVGRAVRGRRRPRARRPRP